MVQFLRRQQGMRSLWTDAFYINQKNLKERADQVATMG